MSIARHDPDVRILKSAVCDSLSGKSRLTYQIGCRGESELLLRIFSNSGAGVFSPEWISLAKAHEIFRRGEQHGVTSSALRPLFTRKGVNTAGFAAAACRDLGVLAPREGKSRVYDVADLPGFVDSLRDLLRSGAAKKARAPAKRTSPGKTSPAKKS